MSISISDTLIPGGTGFGIINATEQNGGYAAAADETAIGAISAGRLVVNGTWRKSIASGTTYILTSLTPAGGFANGTWTPISTATASGSWSPGAATVTTANDGLTGLSARNGYTPVAGDRILVVAQTSAPANGIYVAASGAWSRATDADSAGEFVLGKSVDVTSGTSAGAIYILTAAPTSLGSDPVNFVLNSTGATVNWGVPGALGATTANTVKATTYSSTTGSTSSVTSDGVNSFDEQRGAWVALSSDAATTIFTLPTSIASGVVSSITAEIWITKDGAADFGIWRRTIFVRNQSGSLKNPGAGTTDIDLSPTGNLATGVSTATSVIDVTVNPPVIKVTRPAGVACHARCEVVDVPRGTSGV